MTAVVTVRAVADAAEILRFPMENGEPAANGEWQMVDTVPPGESRNFYAHNSKAIMVRTLEPTEI